MEGDKGSIKMISKDFTYRGKTIEELKAMDTREFAKLVKSRARRSILRNFNEIEDFTVKCQEKTDLLIFEAYLRFGFCDIFHLAGQ